MSRVNDAYASYNLKFDKTPADACLTEVESYIANNNTCDTTVAGENGLLAR